MKIMKDTIRCCGVILLTVSAGGPLATAGHTAGSEEPSYRYQEAECDEIVLRYHQLRPLPDYVASEEMMEEPGAPDRLADLEHAAAMKGCNEIIVQMYRDLREDNPEFTPNP